MIDVHCLIHKESEYFNLINEQMLSERDAKFYVLTNGSNIGLGRCRGFLTGTSPYVSYVDYDDLIEPGIFSIINKVMDSGAYWCYTNEALINKDGEILCEGWAKYPENFHPSIIDFVDLGAGVRPHHILTFRRELITPRMIYIMEQLSEHSEEFLRMELSRYPVNFIDVIGYYWRQHDDSTLQKYRSFRDFMRLKDDKRIDA